MTSAGALAISSGSLGFEIFEDISPLIQVRQSWEENTSFLFDSWKSTEEMTRFRFTFSEGTKTWPQLEFRSSWLFLNLKKSDKEIWHDALIWTVEKRVKLTLCKHVILCSNQNVNVTRHYEVWIKKWVDTFPSLDLILWKRAECDWNLWKCTSPCAKCSRQEVRKYIWQFLATQSKAPKDVILLKERFHFSSCSFWEVQLTLRIRLFSPNCVAFREMPTTASAAALLLIFSLGDVQVLQPFTEVEFIPLCPFAGLVLLE